MGGLPDQVRKAELETDEALEAFERDMAAESAPAEPEETPKPEVKTEAPPKSDTPPTPKVDETPAHVEPPKVDPKYEQMYRTLKGKYDAEVPRLHQRLAELEQELRSKGETKTAAEVESITPDKARDMLTGLVTVEEMNELGDDALVLYAKIASGAAKAQQTKLADEMRQEISDLKSQIVTSKMQDVWDAVEAAHPGARDINENDTEWADFLDGVEPLSGLTYREIGVRAANNGDAHRLVALFDLYAGDKTAIKEVQKEQPPVKPSQRQVATEAESPADEGPAWIKNSDIPKFYDDCRRGVYRGRDDERIAREKEIEAAVAAGRVRLG